MSGVAGYLVRADLRRHWRSVLLLAVLAAVVVGTVLTAFAGSRRSRSAFDRYLDAARPADLIAIGGDEDLAVVEAAPGVETAGRADLLAMFPESADPSQFFPMFAPRATVIGSEQFRLPLVSGRRADPGQALEVNLGERTARRLGVKTGDTLAMVSFTPEEATLLEAEDGGPAEPHGPSMDLTVVGIVREPGDIVGRETDIGVTFLTPAFTERYGGRIGTLSTSSFVRLTDPSAVTELQAATADRDVEIDAAFGAESYRTQADPTMGALATGLLTFGLVAGLAGLVALSQVAARVAQRTAADRVALPAIGVGHRTRRLALSFPIGLGLLAGGLVGVAGSVLASPLLPIGLARRAEPDPGLRVDPLVLAGGLVGTVLLATVAAALVAALADREATARSRPERTGWLAGVVTRASAPVAVTSGVQLAVARGRGSRTLPVRAAVVGVTTAVAGVLATAVFAASSDHLQESPRLYGWDWDAQAVGGEQTSLEEGRLAQLTEKAVADPAFEAVGELWFQLPVTVRGRPLTAIQLTELKGSTHLVVIDGEEPGAGEIALGATTLRSLGRSIGDTVDVQILGAPPARARISGVVAFPVDADGGSSAQGVGLTAAAGRSLGFDGRCDVVELDCNRIATLTWAPGADRRAVTARYEEDAIDIDQPVPPGELASLLAVERLPVLLAVFLAGIGVVAIGYTAAMTVRRRRRDLALLRTLGMTRRDLKVVVFSQTSALVGAGAVLGIVFGVAAGRGVWRLTVDSVHLGYAPVVPLATLALVVGATFVVAHLAAAIPRRRLGALNPASVLRGE